MLTDCGWYRTGARTPTRSPLDCRLLAFQRPFHGLIIGYAPVNRWQSGNNHLRMRRNGLDFFLRLLLQRGTSHNNLMWSCEYCNGRFPTDLPRSNRQAQNNSVLWAFVSRLATDSTGLAEVNGGHCWKVQAHWPAWLDDVIEAWGNYRWQLTRFCFAAVRNVPANVHSARAESFVYRLAANVWTNVGKPRPRTPVDSR